GMLASTESKGQTYVQIGNSSTTNANVAYPSPYGNFFYGARQQYIFTAQELLAANIAPNSIISQLAFRVLQPSGAQLNGFTISMTTTASTSFTSTTFIPNTGIVFGPVNYSDVVGFNTHTLDNPFFFDGISNLVIEICFNNTSWTQNAVVACHSA